MWPSPPLDGDCPTRPTVGPTTRENACRHGMSIVGGVRGAADVRVRRAP